MKLGFFSNMEYDKYVKNILLTPTASSLSTYTHVCVCECILFSFSSLLKQMVWLKLSTVRKDQAP